MRKVMRKGDLSNHLWLDTITDRSGLYGLGPAPGLTGEVLLHDGQTYVSRVRSDSTMTVTRESEIGVPFFVYANVKRWEPYELPPTVRSIADLERFLNERTAEVPRPFAFRLDGRVRSAIIHVQNLAPGTRVRSPADAHQGQVSYPLTDVEATILGFFSTEHQGVFTHHDSFVHLHLMTADEGWMGHLDAVELREVELGGGVE